MTASLVQICSQLLTFLFLANPNLGCSTASAISEALACNRTLLFLSLKGQSGFPLKKADHTPLIDATHKTPLIDANHKLSSLPDTGIGSEGQEIIARALESNEALQILELAGKWNRIAFDSFSF